MDKIKMNIEAVGAPEEITLLNKLPFWLLSLLIVLLPIFVIPSSLVGFLFSKILLLTTIVLISVVLSLFAIIKSGKISLPNWKVITILAIVPLLTIVSSFLSIHRPSSLIGSGAEFDTSHFIVLGFLLIALVAAFFQSKQRIFWAYLAILGMFVVVSIFHIIRFVAGPDMLNIGGAFSTVVANTLGAWSDLGIYAGLAIILSFITIEFLDVGKKLKLAFYGALILGLALLSVTNFYIISNVFGFAIPLTFLVGFIALLVFVYILSLNYRSSKKMPKASLLVLVFCTVMTIGSSTIATFIYSKIGITQNDVIDVRPTFQGTYGVARDLIGQGDVVRVLFGVGPNRFFAAWGLFKPAGVNQTVFWNSDFNYGVSYVLTTIVTVGILGFLAWLVFLAATFWSGIRSVFVGTKDKFSVYIIVSSLLASMYLWFIAFFSMVTVTTLVFAFFFTGLLAASLIRENVIKIKEYSWISSQKKGFVSVLILILLLICTVAWAFGWTQRFVAAIEISKAGVVLTTPENIAESEALIASAIQRAPSHDPYLRSYAQAKLIELQLVLKQSGKNELDEKTKPIITQAVYAAETAAQQNPTDYHNYIFLGQVYQTAGLLGVEKAGDAALNAYKQAYALIPSSPLPAYLAGYLYALAKDSASAKAALQQSLQLKPDFQEAYALYSELEKANPSAQSSASKDIQTSSSPAAQVESKKSSTVTSQSSTSTTSSINSKK
ncbi:MAG: hypothetical protein V4664_03445 [Patescibacteria group bacterium]